MPYADPEKKRQADQARKARQIAERQALRQLIAQTSGQADAAWNPRTSGSARGTGRVEEGEASARPTRCSYAACPKPGREVDEAHPEWRFCLQHFLEHRADLYGEPWPPMVSDPHTKYLDLKPHGTPAAMKRHERAGQELCPQCLVLREERIVAGHKKTALTNWGAA